MITEGQFYDLRSRVALIEADNPTGKTFQPFDEGRGATFIPEATTKKSVIAFGCSFSGLDITVTQGKCYFKGVSKSCTITNPITIAATSYGYYSLALDTGVFTWTVSTSDPGDGDEDTEIWRVFVATVAGGKITELLECQHCDIRSMGNA